MDEFLFSPEQSSMEQNAVPQMPLKVSASGVILGSVPSAAPSAPVPVAVPAPTPVAVPAPTPVVVEEPVTVGAPEPRKNGVWMAIAIIALSLSLLLGAFAIYAASNNVDAFQIPQSNTPSYNFRDNVTEGDILSSQEIIAKVNPSVVTISLRKYIDNQWVPGFATGIIYTDNGYIVTNAHVVEDGVDFVVTDYNGKTYSATVIGYDTQSDLAVIKVNAKKLTPAEFGKSSALVPGDPVIAIGTPYSVALSHSATEGIVSGLRSDMNFSDLGFFMDVVQHTAPINEGNSGGPLINQYGQVIGINSVKITGTFENLGFAIQIDMALPLIEEIMETGKVTRPGIGISGYTYDERGVRGVYVKSVVSGGPAEKAGLREGDIISRVDDETITTIDQLRSLLQSKKIGDTVKITYLRDGASHTTDMVLEELKSE